MKDHAVSTVDMQLFTDVCIFFFGLFVFSCSIDKQMRIRNLPQPQYAFQETPQRPVQGGEFEAGCYQHRAGWSSSGGRQVISNDTISRLAVYSTPNSPASLCQSDAHSSTPAALISTFVGIQMAVRLIQSMFTVRDLLSSGLSAWPSRQYTLYFVIRSAESCFARSTVCWMWWISVTDKFSQEVVPQKCFYNPK